MEENLIKRSKEKDETAFRNLVGLYKNRLYAYLLRFCMNQTAAEDLFQETLIKVWKGLGSYNSTKKFSSWLFAIAHNVAVDFLRKQDKNNLTDSSELLQAEGYNPYEQIEKKELSDYLMKMTDALPEAQKDVFLLRTTAELTFREIAEIRNEPLNSVLSKMNYAVKKLRKIMQEQKVA